MARASLSVTFPAHLLRLSGRSALHMLPKPSDAAVWIVNAGHAMGAIDRYSLITQQQGRVKESWPVMCCGCENKPDGRRLCTDKWAERDEASRQDESTGGRDVADVEHRATLMASCASCGSPWSSAWPLAPPPIACSRPPQASPKEGSMGGLNALLRTDSSAEERSTWRRLI
jgi:hypothetical protein